MKTRARSRIKEPKTTLTIRIPVEEKKALMEEAEKRGTTVTDLIRKSLVKASILKERAKEEWPKPRAIGVKDFSRQDLYD